MPYSKPPSPTQSAETLPKLLIAGLDSLYASFYLDGLGIDWEALSIAKQFAQTERDSVHEITLGSERFMVEPRGAAPYPFVLRNEHFRIRMAENFSPRCHVQYLSRGLWEFGWRTLTDRLADWFTSLGCKELRPASVARADFAFDFALNAVDFDERCFVTRAAKVATYHEHGRVQSFQIGKGDTVIRVYDKVAEIEQASDKAFFYELWGQKENVWRVEAQIRSERLKEAGMGLLQDLHDLQADLLREVFTKHTRLRKPNGDANRSRWPNHPLWKALLAVIADMEQTGLVNVIRREPPLAYAVEKQARSLYGCLKGFAAAYGLLLCKSEPMTLEETVSALVTRCEAFHGPSVWADDVANRTAKRRLGQ